MGEDGGYLWKGDIFGAFLEMVFGRVLGNFEIICLRNSTDGGIINIRCKLRTLEVNRMLSDDMREELIQGLTDIFRSNISMIILYGSVARGDATDESDIDIAIVIRGQMDDATKKRFICWVADMDIRYERVFPIVDIQESNMKKWENVLPFYQNVRKEGIVLWKAA